MSQSAELAYEQFKNIDLSDPFFDSLKADYEEFPTWFQKNQKNGPTFSSVTRAGSTGSFTSRRRMDR